MAKGCLKKGCLGCAAVLAILLVLLIVALLIGLITDPRETRIESVETSHPVAISAAEAGESPGRIVLDVSKIEFEMVPGEPGQPLGLEGSYDTARYRLEERWEADEGGGWTYRLDFGTHGFGLHLFSFDANNNRNRLRLTFPPDVPLEIVGDVGLGQSDVELGGSAVREADLSFGTGEHRVGFSTPTTEPMRRLRLRGSIGEFQVDRVGNASPKEVDVSLRIGELSLDLRGRWRGDATATVRCGVGECGIRAPRDVSLISDVDIMLGEMTEPERRSGPDEIGTPTLTLIVRGRIGEVSVSR